MAEEFLVTKESLIEMLNNPNRAYVEQVIGRALKVLHGRQTEDEKASQDTKHRNQRGFASYDARSGTLSARYFMGRGYLENWHIEMWTRPDRRGTPRLAKYWRQLNEVALARRAAG